MKTLRLKLFSTVLGLLTIGFNDAKKPVDPVWHDILYNQIIPNSFLADYKPFGADKEWLQPYYEKIYTDPKYYPKNYEPKFGLEEDEESLIQCYKQNQKDQETRQKAAERSKEMQRKGKGLWKSQNPRPLSSWDCSGSTTSCFAGY